MTANARVSVSVGLCELCVCVYVCVCVFVCVCVSNVGFRHRPPHASPSGFLCRTLHTDTHTHTLCFQTHCLCLLSSSAYLAITAQLSSPTCIFIPSHPLLNAAHQYQQHTQPNINKQPIFCLPASEDSQTGPQRYQHQQVTSLSSLS